MSPTVQDIWEIDRPKFKRARESEAIITPVMTADISEGEDYFLIQVDIPRVEADKLDVTISNSGILTITAQWERNCSPVQVNTETSKATVKYLLQ